MKFLSLLALLLVVGATVQADYQYPPDEDRWTSDMESLDFAYDDDFLEPVSISVGVFV